MNYYLALDVGGTFIRSGISFEHNGLISQKRKQLFQHCKTANEEINRNLCQLIDDWIQTNPQHQLDGIGLSLAANIDRKNSHILTWPNHSSWNGYPLIDHLKARFSEKIVAEDDANCAAVGEYPNFQNKCSNFACITIGTGIGCGLILNRKLFVGEHGLAGEIGHIIWDRTSKELCSCGNCGCFQSLVSGTALLNKYNYSANESLTQIKQLRDRYLQKVPAATECINTVVSQLQGMLLCLVMILDIPLVAIGGGILKLGKSFISETESLLNEALSKFNRKVSIVPALTGEYSGVLGALHLISMAKRKLSEGDCVDRPNPSNDL